MKKFTTSLLMFLIAMGFSFSSFAQVDTFNNLYSESGNGSIYKNTAYNIYTDDLNDLSTVIVSDSADFLNVYYNDGTNKSYSLHGVAGKNLQEIFGGNNNENQIVDILQLRDNYREWFRRDDGGFTLIGCNAVARMSNAVYVDPIEITTDLTNINAEGTQYDNTAYFVKGIATEDDLDDITVASDVDWVNIYVKSNSGDPYERVDINNVANKTLKTIFNENGITVSDLYYDYKEWFKKDGSNKLVRLNVKAVKEGSTNKVLVTPDLYETGNDDHIYEMTAYEVLSGATHADLAAHPILAADVDFVNIYYNDGTNNLRTSVNITADTDLDAVLTASGVPISQLRDNYLEWFFEKNPDGSYSTRLVKLNMKAVKYITSENMIKVTDGLRTVGTSEDYSVRAFRVNQNATDSALSTYTLQGDAGTNIYYIDVNGNYQNRNVSGTNGKTLLQLLTEQGISADSLRTDYLEWFYDENGKLVLKNLNIKEKTVLPETVKVITTEDLYTHKGDTTFVHTAYYVRKSAAIDDLEGITVADDIEVLEVYAFDTNGEPVVYRITDAAGKTLRENLDDNGISIDDLQMFHWQKFEQGANRSSNTVWVRVNMNASKVYSQPPPVPLSNWAIIFGVMLILLFTYVKFRNF